MPNKREQSAIDAIYKILDEMEILNKRMTIIDNNIKLLNNKIAKINGTEKPRASVPSATASSKPTATSNNEPIKSIKVFGKIKNQRKKPIKDVYVKIFSPKGEVIKSRTTDSDGYWEARLTPGTYGVELNASHINPKFRPINKNIVIDKTMNEYEVK
jgi:hypothetical protein